jgi:hypothetical protein
MVLVWFRKNEDVGLLAAGFGVSLATGYRYIAEGQQVLAAEAPDLHAALQHVAESGWACVVLYGSLIDTDRLAETTTSVKGDAIDAWYSGKHRRPGGNIQAFMRPDEVPICPSPPSAAGYMGAAALLAAAGEDAAAPALNGAPRPHRRLRLTTSPSSTSSSTGCPRVRCRVDAGIVEDSQTVGVATLMPETSTSPWKSPYPARSSNVQHLTLPPALSSSDMSAPIGSKPCSRN